MTATHLNSMPSRVLFILKSIIWRHSPTPCCRLVDALLRSLDSLQQQAASSQADLAVRTQQLSASQAQVVASQGEVKTISAERVGLQKVTGHRGGTRQHAGMHACAHTHVHALTRMCMHSHACACTHTRAHTGR